MESKIVFSVILPVYKGDVPSHFNEAIKSLYQQTLRANEIVVVKDGPLTEALEEVIQNWQKKMPELNILGLPQNVGLSSALNAGINEAKNEWLARMDADDVCRPYRFEKQIGFIKKNPSLYICRVWISEYRQAP